MFKTIGLVTVIGLMFYLGIIQLIAGALALGLLWIAAL